MRLICPNCDAHYEVEAELVPPPGRDLQCSDCGHVWFQDAAPVPSITDMISRPSFESPNAAPEDVPEAPEDEPEIGVTPLAARSLDDTLLSVLREEAQREVQARSQDSGAIIETQDELLLDAGPRRKIVVRPISSPPPEPSDEPAEESSEMVRTSRRERLPDIEHINSTLRASGEKRQHGDSSGAEMHLPHTRATRRRGFRTGFLLVVALAILAALVYRNDATIAQAVPALGPVLETYSNQVNAIRLSFDELIANALVKMTAE